MGAPTLAKEQGCGEVAELMDALVGTVLSRLRGGLAAFAEFTRRRSDRLPGHGLASAPVASQQTDRDVGVVKHTNRHEYRTTRSRKSRSSIALRSHVIGVSY
jgi:hypothetical protein